MRHIKCTHCNQNDTLSGESTPNFFHLFWIPLFRVSTTQIIRCNHCKKGYYKEDFTKEMQAAFEN
ncbi:zinc-ribbon domain-containing protein [Eudoraea sp.]